MLKTHIYARNINAVAIVADATNLTIHIEEAIRIQFPCILRDTIVSSFIVALVQAMRVGSALATPTLAVEDQPSRTGANRHGTAWSSNVAWEGRRGPYGTACRAPYAKPRARRVFP